MPDFSSEETVAGGDIRLATTGDLLMTANGTGITANISRNANGTIITDGRGLPISRGTVNLSAGFGRIGHELYDPSFVFRFDDAERENLINLQWTDERILAEEERLTVAYHTEQIDYFRMRAEGSVTATASGHIYIEHDGDMRVNRIASTGGSLDIWVAGDIRNANPNFEVNPRSDAETSDFWKGLGLIVGTPEYDARIANRIAAYEREFTEIYFQAWRDYNEGDYDPNFVFRFADNIWEDLRNSQLTADLIEIETQRLLAEEQKRTDAYHNALLSDFYLGFHYVVDVPQDPNNYTSEQIQELFPLFVALTANTQWTEKQLENQFIIPTFLLTGDAGTRNSTRSILKEPNFVGQNVTLYATGAIGNELANTVDIPNMITVEQLRNNPDWQRAIADAEWDDVDRVSRPGYYLFMRPGITISRRGTKRSFTTSRWVTRPARLPRSLAYPWQTSVKSAENMRRVGVIS